MTQRSRAVDVKQHAGWLPGPDALDEWVAQHVDESEKHADEPLHPTIQAFQRLIDSDAIELGAFRYGGSTTCLLFEPGVIREFALSAIPQPGDPDAALQHVRARLATADLDRARG